MENNVRKGGIACNEKFLLFSQCFLPYMALIFLFQCTLKCCMQYISIWTSLNFCNWLTQSRLLTTLKKKPFENIVGNAENAGYQHFLHFPKCFLPIPKRIYQHFLHFPKCFLPIPKRISIFMLHLFCRPQMLSIWTSLKFCRLVMG